MQAVFNIHGRFEPEIAIPWEEGMDLEAVEQKWLDEHFRKPGCVNLSSTSDGGGGEWSEESRQKSRLTYRTKPGLAAKQREILDRIRPQAHLALAAKRGPKRPKPIAKMVKTTLGLRHPPETIKQMSESAKVRCVAHPQAHDQDTRTLISTQQKGRIWVHNSTTNRRLWPKEAEELIGQGWVLGKINFKAIPDKQKGRIGIRKGLTSRKVWPDEAEELLKQGWELGDQKSGQVWVHTTTGESRLVWPQEAEELIAQGWLAGNGQTLQKGLLWINDGYTSRKVWPNEVEELTKQGWERGKTHHSTGIPSQQKGLVWINNGTKNRRVQPEDVKGLLDQGWVQGFLG